jgi:hypothetical protein
MGMLGWLRGFPPRRASAAQPPRESDVVSALDPEATSAGETNEPLQQLESLAAEMSAHQQEMRRSLRIIAREQDQRLKAALERLEATTLTTLERSAASIQAHARSQLHVGEHLAALQARRREQVQVEAVFSRLARLADSGRPFVVGPWSGDVGTELLYWVPFVRWFVARFGVATSRVHVVSRGGAPWYGDLAKRYTDMFAVDGPGPSTSQQDTRSLRAFDRRVLRRMRADHPERYSLLHPGLMDRLFAPYWKGDLPFDHIVKHTVPGTTPASTVGGLPERYTAVRFAFGPSFPATPENHAWLDALLMSLAHSRDVVWLGHGVDGVDGLNQKEYTPPADLPLHRLDSRSPEHELTLQAAVIAGAETYVGTYGGLAYVAAYHGVRSVAFHAARCDFPLHRRTAAHMFKTGNSGRLIVVGVDDAGLLCGATDTRQPTP